MSEAQTIGQLIQALGSDRFGPALLDTFNQRLGATRCHAFSFMRRSSPLCVIAHGLSADVTRESQALARDYIQGDYRSDPLLLQYPTGSDGRIWISRTTPRSVANRFFRSKYYERTGISNEVSILCETSGRMIYAGFCRMEPEAPFSEDDIQQISCNAPIVLSAISKHLELVAGNGQARRSAPWMDVGAIRSALIATNCGITAREAEICALIVRGYLANAIAAILGISPHTVATHRKRAYAKLGVSRQAELFARCLEHLAPTARNS